MTAREYLEQIDKADFGIRVKQDEIDRLENLALNISSKPTDNERVKSSGSQDKVANIVVMLIDKKNELAEYIERSEYQRELIISQIEGLENTNHARVLYLRYVKRMTFADIAEDMDKTTRYTMKLCQRAESEMNKKYEF